MAILAVVVLGLLTAQGCDASRADAQRRAQEWMRMHEGQDPDQAGLDELKATNPDAFAIVNALLTKRSLGMLNLKHPSSSFKPDADEEAPKGPSAVDFLRSVSSPQPQPGSAVEAPVAAVEMSAPVSHHSGSWLNWKPHEDDDAMVSNVLGAVNELKSGGVSQGAAPAQDQDQAPAPVEEPKRLGALSFDWGNTHAAAQQAAAPPAAEAPQSSEPQNAYLASIGGGFMGSTGSAAKPAAPQGNLLTSFNWDSSSVSSGSDQPKADTALQQQSTDAQAPAQSSSPAGGALGRWLR